MQLLGNCADSNLFVMTTTKLYLTWRIDMMQLGIHVRQDSNASAVFNSQGNTHGSEKKWWLNACMCCTDTLWQVHSQSGINFRTFSRAQWNKGCSVYDQCKLHIGSLVYSNTDITQYYTGEIWTYKKNRPLMHTYPKMHVAWGQYPGLSTPLHSLCATEFTLPMPSAYLSQ